LTHELLDASNTKIESSRSCQEERKTIAEVTLGRFHARKSAENESESFCLASWIIAKPAFMKDSMEFRHL
jgi:hypothetical protein